MISWDIETEPQALDELKAKLPEFDPDSVKTGNLKDPEKIKAKIDAARASHESTFIDRAALSATTGRVLAIGYYYVKDASADIDGMCGHNNEMSIVANFWTRAEEARDNNDHMIGLNIFDFDLPFLIRRSWILDVDVPDWVVVQGRYFDPLFVDLRKVWLLGQMPANCKSSFDELGRAFGSGGKDVEGCTGANFHKMWWAGGEDREKAVEYLKNDIKQPVAWAEMMGIL